MVALFQCFDGLQVVAAGALRGLSDATVPMLICLFAYWLVFIPSAYAAAFRFGFGALGIWSAMVAALAIAAALLMARFVSKSAA